MLSFTDSDTISTKLAELIARVRKSNDPICDLLLEHLQTAAGYVQGAMPAECMLNLEETLKSAKRMHDAGLRQIIESDVTSVLNHIHS